MVARIGHVLRRRRGRRSHERPGSRRFDFPHTDARRPKATSTASPIIGDLEAALESETDAQVRENLEDAIADLREG